MGRHGLHQPQRIARQRGVGQRVGLVQVGGAAGDAVELGAERDAAAEHAAVLGQVGRWRVAEADALRPPALAQQCLAHAPQHAHGQFHGLAHGAVQDEVLAQDDDVPCILQVDQQRFVDQVHVRDQRVQRMAQRGLVLQQQAHGAEARQLAVPGHAQAQGLAARGLGRVFQQARDDGHVDQLVLLAQQRGPQAGLAQCLVGVAAQFAHDVRKMGQGRRAHHGDHACPPVSPWPGGTKCKEDGMACIVRGTGFSYIAETGPTPGGPCRHGPSQQ